MRERESQLSVAVFHPRMGFGGSEAVALWTLEALKRDYRIALVASGRIDLPKLNAFCGTSVNPDECQIVELKLPWSLARVEWGAAIRGALFHRASRAVWSKYDLLISAYNPSDFGVPAIQFIADFSWDEELRTKYHPPPGGFKGIFHRRPILRRAYLALVRSISPPSNRDFLSCEDLILANSRWTAERLRIRYGLASEVLYPPVATNISHIPWEGRRDDFVCIGRVSPEKRIGRIVRIIAKVRQRGYAVRLRIAGGLDGSLYAKQIASLAHENSSWVVLEGSMTADEKAELFGGCRYGIHGAEGEGFGIGVAEMVKAGCITFAPVEGGPTEILGHDALLYHGDDDAVEKICAVLSRRQLQASLLDHLRRQGEGYSAERFMRDLRAAVEKFLAKSSLSARVALAADSPARTLQAPL